MENLNKKIQIQNEAIQKFQNIQREMFKIMNENERLKKDSEI